LFSLNPLGQDELRVTNDADSFYGKQYWLEHMTEELGFSDIFQRAQSDLTERCLHWLETLLRYRLPPAIRMRPWWFCVSLEDVRL
jgi:hypothetical protein